MDRYTQVRVCGASKLEYTNGRNDVILEVRGGWEQQVFISLQRGNRNFKAA